ncbi:hypothetical protein PRIPAC_85631 [Pristionchus pacificus]|nr:hypothetical protein PRIPAC_85631 [Pristionchus pacificus]
MANKNWKEKRRRDKICMAALLFHSTVFGVSSETLARSRMKIAAFSSKSKEPIYYVKSDVFKFFPSIDQNELLSLVHDIVQRDCVVTTVEYDKIINGRKYLVVKNRASDNPIQARTAFNSLFNLPSRQKTLNLNFSTTIVSRSFLLEILISEIKHTVKYDGVIYSVRRGIGQGSVYSCLLGNIYLHERMNRICPLHSRESLLLCYADDFILLSHLKHIVRKFHERVIHEDMGIKGNDHKTLTNIHCEEHSVLHWCGIIFGTTRFVQIDKRRK